MMLRADAGSAAADFVGAPVLQQDSMRCELTRRCRCPVSTLPGPDLQPTRHAVKACAPDVTLQWYHAAHVVPSLEHAACCSCQ